MKKFFLYLLPVLIYAGIIFYFSSLSNVGISLSFDSDDLSLHSLEYIGFGFLIHRLLVNSKLKHTAKIIILISLCISVLYGLSDEIHQGFVPKRTPSLVDLIADSFGALVGILIYQKLKSIRK